jgi:hypothetical protein
MNAIIWGIVLVVMFVTVYAFWIRPKVASLPAYHDQFAQLDAKEAGAMTAFKLKIRGWKTVIITALGLIVTQFPDVLQQAVGVDLTAFGFDETVAKRTAQTFMILALLMRAMAKGPVGSKAE